MDQTLLVSNIPITIFIAQSGKGLTISSLLIDFDPLPFKGGYVVQVNDTYIDVDYQVGSRSSI